MHIEIGAARAMENRLFRSMFEQRKRVFVDLLRWDVPVLVGRYEIDQFDNDCAVYIVIADAEGEHLASVRLLPTCRDHILGTIFPELCEGEIVRIYSNGYVNSDTTTVHAIVYIVMMTAVASTVIF